MTDDEWDGDENDPEFQRILEEERTRILNSKPAATLALLGLLVGVVGVLLSGTPIGIIGVIVGVVMLVIGLWRMARRADRR